MDQDRPRKKLSDDGLGREPFVKRLCGSLVTSAGGSKDSGKSTGLVVGLAGEWGSGKSTILNFVEDFLRSKYKPIAIVRFDPWLISGRDDLIRNFLNELSQEIKKAAPTQPQQVKDLLKKINQYGELLDIGADFLPVSEEMRKKIKAIRKALFPASGGGLHEFKQQVMTLIGDMAFPIVVLIDEVDRVDDDEIKTLVQLVKSVADFPNVSYLIAYDTMRVIQALGASAPEGKDMERGRNFLEKIVQLQVPVPVIFDSEMTASLVASLRDLRDKLFLSDSFATQIRFTELTELLFGGLIRTPRDLKRLLGVFRVLRGMTKEDVDWVDVLGYSALICKAPDITARVQRDPLFFTTEFKYSLRWDRERRRLGEENSDRQDYLVLGPNWRDQSFGHLLQFLFPRLAPTSISSPADRDEDVEATRISRYRALSILVRHGMPPGTWSVEEIRDLVSTVSNGEMSDLENALSSDREADLIVALETRADLFTGRELSLFWVSVGQWLKKPDEQVPTSLDPKWRLVHGLSVVADNILSDHQEFGSRIWDFVKGLRDTGANEFLSGILRRQARAHGLFDMVQKGSANPAVNDAELEIICLNEAEDFKTKHQEGNWLFSNWTMQPVFMLSNFGLWGDEERKRIREITEDRSAFRAFIMMLFSLDHVVDSEFLHRIYGLSKFMERHDEEMGDKKEMDALGSDMQYALDRAWRYLNEKD